MKHLTTLTIFSIFIFHAVCVFAFTGLALPYYEGQASLDLDALQEMLDQKNYKEASMGLSIYLLLHGSEPQAGRAYTMLGVALWGSENYKQAAIAFEAASSADKQLADVAALYRIKALEKADDPGAALKAVDEFNSKFSASRHSDGLDEIRAELLFDAGRYTEAAAAFMSLASAPPQYSGYSKYRVRAVESYTRAGDEEAAKKAVGEVLLEAPPGRYTEAALEFYFRFYGKPGPRLSSTALTWYDDGKYRQAAPVLGAMLKQWMKENRDPDDVYELRVKYAYALFVIHDNKGSLAQYDILIGNRGASDRPHSLYRKAKLQTRMGDNNASKQTFEQLLKEHSSSGYANASRYQLALINMEDNNYGKAYNYFKWRVTKPGGNKEYLHWLAAWNAYRLKYYDAAAGHLEHLLKTFKKSRTRDRYRFWRARIYAIKKDEKSAVDIFKSLNSANPLSYYGMKSYEELKKRKIWGRSIQSVIRKSGKGGPPKHDPSVFSGGERARVERIIALARFRMYPEAQREIASLTYKFEDMEDEKKKYWPEIYALSVLFQRSGAFNKAMKFARDNSVYSYCKSVGADVGSCYYSFKYPIGYADLVEQYAGKRNLPLAVVYGLIHQESTYRPSVVSPAHAVGLMQIIPKTGHEIAGDLGVSDFTVEDLYDPETNIDFGTHYLQKVMAKFNSKLPAALGSYNAGPDVVGKWIRNKGTLPDEIFIEEIPYKETNNYVKKILTKIEIYKALYYLP